MLNARTVEGVSALPSQAYTRRVTANTTVGAAESAAESADDTTAPRRTAACSAPRTCATDR